MCFLLEEGEGGWLGRVDEFRTCFEEVKGCLDRWVLVLGGGEKDFVEY